MRAVNNPVRRNRNIGTIKQGYGQDNRLIIPATSNGFYGSQIGPHDLLHRELAGRCINFFVEHPSKGWVHPCSVDDVVKLFTHINAEHWVGLTTIVFCQPTRKQAILAPVWGRLSYSTEIKTRRGQVRAGGPVLFVAAIKEGAAYKFPSSLGPEDALELERLRADGHEITFDRRYYNIRVTRDSARNTTLYRTIPHEVGHWLDWLQRVHGPVDRGGDYRDLANRYFARPSSEREVFAHRYATEIIDALRAKGALPFERLLEDPIY